MPVAADANAERGIARDVPGYAGGYEKLAKKLGVRAYFANLHAHHFMGAKGSKKNPMSLEEAIAPGPCRVASAQFPADDGRPCRDDESGENVTIEPRTKRDDGSADLVDYFKQACEYGVGKGKLDVLFITPHTKDNQTPAFKDGWDAGLDEAAKVKKAEQIRKSFQLAADSAEQDLLERFKLLSTLNPAQDRSAKNYCGMGQEASSISAGNHVNIFGQFRIGKESAQPFFFPSGQFGKLYPEIGRRIAAGERILLQMNHPDVRSFERPWQGDLWLGKASELLADKRNKGKMNDYGLDDFAPTGCRLGTISGEACAGIEGDELTIEDVKKTYAEIRKVSGDPFRLIEVVSPSLGGAKEGDESDTEETDASKEGFGATTNTKTGFRKVQRRESADTFEEGVYHWIFYLSMGFKLAPTANQDNHFMNFGSATASRTGILARDLREASILDAIDRRRAFASEDVNAGVMTYAETMSGGKSAVGKGAMGDAIRLFASVGKSTRIHIAYQDPDSEESEAEVRLYYYRENDSLDFGHEAVKTNVFRTVGWETIPTGYYRAILPQSDAAGRAPNDLIPIRSGTSVRVDLPLVKGSQWVFAEIIQKGDRDKMWTAPIWIDRR
jgi:hypothetical protein